MRQKGRGPAVKDNQDYAQAPRNGEGSNWSSDR